MKRGHSVNLRQIARRAGCTAAAVSLALRDDPSIPPVTRQRIKQLAQKMGYRPNALISILMSRIRTRRRVRPIPILAWFNHGATRVLSIKARRFPSFFEGAAQRAEQRGFQLQEFWLHEPGMTVERLDQTLFTRNIAGLILAPFAKPEEMWPFHWERYAVAVIGKIPLQPPIHRSDACDHYNLGLCLKKLGERGCRRVGLILTQFAREQTGDEFTSRFLLYQHEIPAADRVPIFWSDRTSLTDPYPKLDRWMEKHRPEVIIFENESIRTYANHRGLSVPRDIGLVSLNVRDAPEPSGYWAGINQNNDKLGSAAVDLVITQLHNNERGVPAVAYRVLIEGEWVEGQTLPSV